MPAWKYPAVPVFGSKLDTGLNGGHLLQDILAGHPHMPGGPARGKPHEVYICEHLVCQAALGQVNLSAGNEAAKGIADSFGLFVDLLDHEVLITVLLGGLRVPGDLCWLESDLVAVQVKEVKLAGKQLCNLEIADIVDAPGVVEYRRDIGGKAGKIGAGSEDQRRVLAGRVDLPRIVTEHQRQGITAPDTDKRAVDGVHGTKLVLVVIIVHQLDDDLGICLAVELIAMPRQLGLQLHIVLNDSVVYTDNLRLDLAGA